MRLSADGHYQLDTVERSDVIMDAAALARACKLKLGTCDGRRAARADLTTGSTWRFPLPQTDLRAYDRLVLVLHTGARSVRPNLFIELTTRAPGLVHNDSFNTGSGAIVSTGGWGEYPFPWENFLIFGFGELVHPVREVKLALAAPSAPGPVWLAELRAEKRGRAVGPRLTDAGLLAALDLPGVGLDGLIAHFRARTTPRHPYAELPAAPAGWTPDAADAICQHRILGYPVGDPINWRANPNGYLEWMHAFNRTTWFNTLTQAVRASGDAKYVRALDAIWASWLRDNPEPIAHNGGGDPAWETLSTAARIYGSWLVAWFGLLHHPDFSDRTRREILKSFHGHAEHLLAHQGHGNNWLVVESRVLYTLGLLFPEFKRAPLWLAEGERRLAREIGVQVFPDGADFEFAPGYHMMACRGFLDAYELAQMNGRPTPPLFAERLPRTFEYIAGMTRPDGTLPSVNDSGGYRGNRGGRDYLAYGARLFARPDLNATAEGPFAGRSRAFADAGFHVQASGTGAQALWLLLDAGTPGASHQHDDALSLECFALGLPFIVDPGITGYFSDDWTAYYRQTAAHNTVLVNERNQLSVYQRKTPKVGSVRGQVFWAPGETCDYVCGEYRDGYDGLPADVRHRRAVLFVRGQYWVVFDEVFGAAARTLEARFQFAPMRVTVDARAHRFRTLRQSRPNLELIAAGPGVAKLALVCGETAPVAGWVSDGEDLPAPQARVRVARRSAKTPLRLITVLLPFAEGVSSRAQVRGEAKADGTSLLALCRPGQPTHRVRFSWAALPTAAPTLAVKE